MKRLSFILVLFFLLSLVTMGFDWSMNGNKPVSVSIKDLPEGLQMVPPSDENFTEILAKSGDFAPAAEAVTPYSVILQNTGTQPAVAFMLKWDLVDSAGLASSRQYQYSTVWALEGEGINRRGGYIIRPGSDWFLAPGIAVELNNDAYSGLPRHLAAVARDMAQYTSVTVSLDGVFFADGTFVGSNKTGFFEKSQALLKARRDVLEELSNKTKAGMNEKEVFREAEELAKKPKTRLGRKSTLDDYYNSFKEDFAQDVLKMKSVSGSQKTIDHYLAGLKREWPTLKKKN